ncbi:MAG: hypothetical protein D6719_09430 [Candidatus Dadabacteria bacterium]|nr:MAG: hypothetical protein D6719_09430 [Candidatus Dadabacteria bacterium]
MSEYFLGITIVLVLGIFAQWVAWAFRLPSILLLLLTGILVGPILGWIDPDRLFADLLFPVISLSVAVILYEGGLTLRFRDVRRVRGSVFALISIGMLITWLVGSWGAQALLGFKFEMAVLLGALLTVSGPTVIIPLLRHVRPAAPLGAILRWEGILIDPVGALMAVLVLEAILDGSFESASLAIIQGALYTLLVGSVLGAAGALIMILLLRRYWLPDYLHNPVSLMILFIIYALSNYLRPESGLLAATVMGMVLANWKGVVVQHIVEFKENLRVLLISSLFIVLGARLKLEDLSLIDFNSVLFLLLLIFVARPIAVFASTALSKLSWREKLFLSFVAPRGIVAAAVSSLFALELSHSGVAGAELLVYDVFFVIIGTVAFYGFLATPIATLLGVRLKNPQGAVIVGGHLFAREIARALNQENFRTVIIDANYNNILDAKSEGLEVYHGNVLSEHIIDELDLNGIGKLFALTRNDDANSLAALHFIEEFGRSEVYQLASADSSQSGNDASAIYLRGRILFDRPVHFNDLKEAFERGAKIKTTTLSEQYGFEEFKNDHGDNALPLFLINENELLVFTESGKLKPRPGSKLVYVDLRGE